VGDQFFRAWAIDPDALDDLVGGDLIKPRKSRVVDDVRQMVGGDLDSLFREIASGKLDPTHPYRYRAARRSQVVVGKRELKAFDSAIVVERGVPKSVPRFGEGEWPMDDLAGELEHLVATWRTWLAAAKREKLSLAIWHDGDS